MDPKELEHKLAALGSDKKEPKFGGKEWLDSQIWTKPFRKAFGVKLKSIKSSKKKLNRNDLCECGSGLKYKKCCGK